MIRAVLSIAAVLLVTCEQAAGGQKFEVASIRPSQLTINGSRTKVTQDRVIMEHILLATCIKWAYNLKDYQVSGLDSLGDKRFDIEAKAPDRATPEELRLMFQTLLSERFDVKIHWEERVLPAYALVVAKNGLKMQASTEEGKGSISVDGPVITGKKVTTGALADLISKNVAHSPVLDTTGLTGRYDFTMNMLAYVAESAELRASDSVGILNGVLQSKLGLKLESKKAPIQMLVLDHVGRAPTDN